MAKQSMPPPDAQPTFDLPATVTTMSPRPTPHFRKIRFQIQPPYGPTEILSPIPFVETAVMRSLSLALDLSALVWPPEAL